MQYRFFMRLRQASVPLQPSRSLYELHPGSIDEEIAAIYVNPPLLDFLRWWENSWISNFLAVENQYVNNERAALLRGAFEKLVPLLEASTPVWISLDPQYPDDITSADAWP